MAELKGSISIFGFPRIGAWLTALAREPEGRIFLCQCQLSLSGWVL